MPVDIGKITIDRCGIGIMTEGASGIRVGEATISNTGIAFLDCSFSGGVHEALDALGLSRSVPPLEAGRFVEEVLAADPADRVKVIDSSTILRDPLNLVLKGAELTDRILRIVDSEAVEGLLRTLTGSGSG